MESEEGGTLLVGLTTPDVEVEEPPLVGPTEGPATVVTTEDAATALTVGAKEATQTITTVGTDVTDTL